MSKKVFLFIGLFWLAIFAVFIASKESVLRGGQEVLLQTVPVDPRDIFRGDYVTLRYEISTLDQADVVIFNRGWNESLGVGDKVYVNLLQDGEYARADGINLEQPDSGIFIAGTVKSMYGSVINVDYGIESYFVPEGTGHDIEDLSGELAVRVALSSSGRAVIKELVYPPSLPIVLPPKTPTTNSGVKGIVLLGPICPVMREGDSSCDDNLYQTTIGIREVNSRNPMAAITNDTRGYFEVSLPSGVYIFEPVPRKASPDSPFPFCAEQTVVVNEGSFTDVVLHCDTGIR
ncbi:MAG TPA: GDYXXLXY domain-containing protein [Candidatus Paceibacterota bacterium]